VWDRLSLPVPRVKSDCTQRLANSNLTEMKFAKLPFDKTQIAHWAPRKNKEPPVPLPTLREKVSRRYTACAKTPHPALRGGLSVSCPSLRIRIPTSLGVVYIVPSPETAQDKDATAHLSHLSPATAHGIPSVFGGPWYCSAPAVGPGRSTSTIHVPSYLSSICRNPLGIPDHLISRDHGDFSTESTYTDSTGFQDPAGNLREHFTGAPLCLRIRIRPMAAHVVPTVLLGVLRRQD
jgi:hypothetical protein